MSKITNVRLPNAAAQSYSPEQFNQLVRSLEQVILQLNNTYTPVTSENTMAANTWFEASLGVDEMTTNVAFPSVAVDAFGRLRVSNPYTLFDSQNRYQKDPQFNETLTTGGTSTYVANESTVDLAVTTSSGSKVVRQTNRVFPYQPGKGLLVLATFVMNAGKTNLRQRVGYFNTDNGVFFQANGTTKSFVLRTNTSGTPSDARTADQSTWNGDKLDGSGPSGITLDITKSQILWMDFEWLGVGSVRCGFVINGQFIVCHTFNNANEQTKVYMTTAILPIRYEILDDETNLLNGYFRRRIRAKSDASVGAPYHDVDWRYYDICSYRFDTVEEYCFGRCRNSIGLPRYSYWFYFGLRGSAYKESDIDRGGLDK
jgi:hypothetical protein